jgi:VanZ family protein
MAESPHPPWRSVKLWPILLAGYWLALFTGTHVPSDFPLLPSSINDKLMHTSAFAGLAFLLASAWQQLTGRLTGRHLCAAWLLLAAYGVVDELTQIPVGRSCDIRDWVADISGITVGLLAFWLWQRWTQPQ